MLGPLLLVVAAARVHGGEPAQRKQPIVIAVAPQASRLEESAGEQLATSLEKIYRGQSFLLAEGLPARGPAVLVGSVEGESLLGKYVKRTELAGPGSFLVKTVKEDDRQIGIVAGADPRATLHGVYALAERLGLGFYLSYDAALAVPGEPFNFERWDLGDAPLVGERIVFNWHNFLSSCSTWDLPDWQHWIRQTAKMRYTGIMVHAYGNNPMVCFTHNGQTKPVGYLSTTVKGRDWGTQHVNDVRLLYGAEGVFDGPVFGCKAAMVPDDQRVAAAKALMREVFAYAEQQGVEVVFALDVDTASSNPPNVIGTLPPSARFGSSERPLANPDTPEGFGYYKTQLETLFGDYPQIDRLVVWFRSGRTLWRSLKPEDFPQAWKAEYEAAVAKQPEIPKHRDGPSMFAISKIVRTFRKILDETGREDVELGIGSWAFTFMPAADAFMPRDVAFIPLDTGIQFENPQIQRQIRSVGVNRPVIPIVWAHHDDRTYIGRPYTPPATFASQLNSCRAAGFGIIHWTTRPLDIYFKSLSEQTWKHSRDMPLEGTCRQMAARTFGPELREALGEYVYRFVTEAPQFGRETTDRFIDRPLDNPDKAIASARKRLEMLEAVDPSAEAPRPPSSLEPRARRQLEYYKSLEAFFAMFYTNELRLQKSKASLSRGDFQGARQHIEACDPETAIEVYARAARQCGITRGEQALIISMNLRWLPYFEAQRQSLGLSPVRINFQPTQHDPLAQGAGHRTFFVDPKRRFWLGLGEKETGVKVYGPYPRKVPMPTSPEELVCLTCIGSGQPIRLKLRNMTGGPLAQGVHKVSVLLADGLVENPARPLFDLVLRGSTRREPVTDRIDFAPRIKLPNAAVKLAYTLRIDQGYLDLELKPVRGNVPLAGVVIECLKAEHQQPGRNATRENTAKPFAPWPRCGPAPFHCESDSVKLGTVQVRAASIVHLPANGGPR